MRNTQGNHSRPSQPVARPARFARLAADSSGTASLLHGCPVVTVGGARIGTVGHVMVDIVTNQLRYVVLAHGKFGTVVAIPWHALYFDAGHGRLVFYTLA